MKRPDIRIVAAAGSVRPGNFTSKVLELALAEIRRHADIRLEVIDLAAVDLPQPGIDGSGEAARLRRMVADATGLILATPEYHGSYSSVIKLLIENLGFPSVLAGKPIALLGVAAGRRGAVKALEHLGSVCSHVGATVLPGAVSLAGVQDLFDGDGRCLDRATEERVRGLARDLIDHVRAGIRPRAALEQFVGGRPAGPRNDRGGIDR